MVSLDFNIVVGVCVLRREGATLYTEPLEIHKFNIVQSWGQA